MSKNNAFINHQKMLARKIKEVAESVMPEVFACTAVVLWDDYSWTEDEIVDFLMKTNEIWEYCANGSITANDYLFEHTGMKIENGK